MNPERSGTSGTMKKEERRQGGGIPWTVTDSQLSMDRFKTKFTGIFQMFLENPWFPVDFPNQSMVAGVRSPSFLMEEPIEFRGRG